MDLEKIKRQLLFKKCNTQEELHAWVKIFLDIDLPNCTVDETSTSNPMELLWSLYSKAMAGDDEAFTRVLAYASRDGGKTAVSAIMEALFLIHLDRDIIHGAALEEQSKKCKNYMTDHFLKPYLRDLVISNNARNIEIAKYKSNHDPDDILTPKEWLALPPNEQLAYSIHKNIITIVVATLKSMNGQHAPVLLIDERRLDRS